MAVLKKGLVQIYTGNGKGKTTAALGAAWRMMGAGGQVYICQFLKPANVETSEARLAKQFHPQLTWERLEDKWDMHSSADNEQNVQEMRRAIAAKLEQIKATVQAGQYDLIILDEIVFCLSKGLAKEQDITAIIESRAPQVELILTGRGADEGLIKQVDLVTEMQEIKHPYSKGISARKGIEF